MQQLSALDAAFVYLDSPRTPMHVAGLYLFAPPADRPAPDLERLRARLAGRLLNTPLLRRRLVRVPGNLDHPYWVDDADVDLDRHLLHARVPAPGDHGALMALASTLFEHPLDLHRAPWEITLIEGLDEVDGLPPGAFALLVKLHHGAADGRAGQALVWSLLDSDDGGDRPAPAWPVNSDMEPGSAGLLARAAGHVLRSPLTLARLGFRALGNAAEVARLRAVEGRALPALRPSAPSLPFNAPVSGQRSLAATCLSRARLEVLRGAVPEATLNDLVLALCGGALRRYLLAHDALPAGPVVALVPRSLRGEGGSGEGGNRLAALPVGLATDEADPVRRLLSIQQSATVAKTYGATLGSLEPLEALPPLAAALGGRALGQLGTHLGLPFNLIVTNLAGPGDTLYLDGAPLRRHYAATPLHDGVGLVVVVTSYRDTVCLSLTTCPALVPDPEVLIAHLEAALAELEQALGVAAPAA